MAANVQGDQVARARELLQKIESDADLRRRITEAPTLEAKGEIAAQAGYPDVSLEAAQAAASQMVEGQSSPEGTKRAKQFLARLVEDQDLGNRLNSAPTPEAKQQILQDAGFGDVTIADLMAASNSVNQAVASGEELSDEDLALVSGGVWSSTGGYIGQYMLLTVSAGSTVGAVGGPKGAAAGAAIGGLVGIGLGFAKGVPEDKAAGRKCYVVEATATALDRPYDWSLKRMTMIVHRAVGEQPLGDAVLRDYAINGPEVVAAINARPDARAIYADVERRLVERNMELVREGRAAEAGRNFVTIVRDLQTRYVFGQEAKGNA